MTAVDRIEFTVRETGNCAPEKKSPRFPFSRMSSSELLRFGVSAKFSYSSGPSPDHPETADLAAQLSEARAEWNRRHPNLPLHDSF
jgi:hypothetical protein